MKRRKPKPRVPRSPELSVERILQWADAWFRRTGQWPCVASGRIPGTFRETWANVDNSLRGPWRGLPYRTTLARLLADKRGVRNHMNLPRLSVSQILSWADAHYRATGAWPNRATPGDIADAPGETWIAIEMALRDGLRGLPGGSTLAQVLAHHRGVRNQKFLPPLTRQQVLAWADAHHQRTGEWPTRKSGSIPEAPGETWLAVSQALHGGGRGFPGGSSLAQLLARHRGVRNLKELPPLTEEQILTWADAHRRRTGRWPGQRSGPVVGSRSETWLAIEMALRHGRRSLPGGSSLARLLARHRAGTQP